MQVKNFGRSGRTKYTHLVDQDTSQSDAAWSAHSAQNLKFHTQVRSNDFHLPKFVLIILNVIYFWIQHAGGVKQVFERPALRKSKHSGSWRWWWNGSFFHPRFFVFNFYFYLMRMIHDLWTILKSHVTCCLSMLLLFKLNLPVGT